MVHVLTPMVVVPAPVLVLVMFPEDHFLAAGRVLGHVDVGVAEVVVVAACGLVAGVVVGFLVFESVSG